MVFKDSDQRRTIGFAGSTKALGERLRKVLQTKNTDWEQNITRPGASRAVDALGEKAVLFVEINNAQNMAQLEAHAKARSKKQRIIVISSSLDHAEIRKLLQLGVADWLTPDTSDAEIQSACEEHRHAARDGARNIFAFTPVLGGMGATTIAIETAIILNDHGKHTTCVIDLDFYAGECADYLNIEPKLQLDALASTPDDIDDHFLNSVLSEQGDGLFLLAAQTHLGAHKHINTNVVIHLLNLVSARFEHVIIDLPRSWYDWTDDVLLGTDTLFLITDATVPALRAAKRQLEEYRQRYAGKVVPKVIVNKQMRGWMQAGLSETDLRKSLNNQFLGSIADDTQIAREAINRGVPISTVKNKARMVQDLRKIVQLNANK